MSDAAVATKPAPKEATPNERAQALLTSMTEAARHNAPITHAHLTELAAVVNHMTGDKAVTPSHPVTDARGLPGQVFVGRLQDDHLTMITTAEEALAYVRSLPADVQARPHWVAADKALVEAVASVQGTDVSPAVRLFETAVAEDRKVSPKPAPKIADKPHAKPHHA
jgi:hypothetical protein